MKQILQIVAQLNRAMKLDPAAITALVDHRVPVNQELLDNEACSFVVSGSDVAGWQMGMLDVFNGLGDWQDPLIVAVYDDDNNLQGFRPANREQKITTVAAFMNQIADLLYHAMVRYPVLPIRSVTAAARYIDVTVCSEQGAPRVFRLTAEEIDIKTREPVVAPAVTASEAAASTPDEQLKVCKRRCGSRRGGCSEEGGHGRESL